MMNDPNDGGPRFATCLGLRLGEPISPRHFAEVREAGFDAVEVAANYREHMRGTPAEVELIKSSARDNGLSVASVHLGFDALTGDRQKEVDDLIRRDLELTADLGAKTLIVHLAIFADPDRLICRDGKLFPGFTVDRDLDEWPPMVERIHEKLDAYVQAGKQVGVAVALETDWQGSHRLIEFVEPFDEECCGICFDTGHAELDSGAVKLAELLGPRVICTHLHDNDGKEDQHLPPFDGVIDWPKLIAALRAAGYSGLWTFETLRGTLDDIKAARNRIAELWSAPGHS